MTQDRRPRGRGAETPARYAHCQEILEIALRCTLRLGLPPDDAEDCALSFVGRVLLDDTEAALRPPETRHLTGTLHVPWVARAALNHARDFQRRTRQTKGRERPWPHRVDDGGVGPDLADPAPGAEALLLRRAVSEALLAAAAGLNPVPCSLLLGHHVGGRSVPELAAATGRTQHAVEQALHRSRRRVRAYLERRGWGAEELRLHLAPPPGVWVPGPCTEEPDQSMPVNGTSRSGEGA